MSWFSLQQSDVEKRKQELEKLKGNISADARLAEVEKEFKEGITTLKDLLAPSALRITA